MNKIRVKLSGSVRHDIADEASQSKCGFVRLARDSLVVEMKGKMMSCAKHVSLIFQVLK